MGYIRVQAPLRSDERGPHTLGAWFLGPKGENRELLARLASIAIDSHASSRADSYPADPLWIDAAVKASPAYVSAVKHLEKELSDLLDGLTQSVPFYSYRYQGHMLWDVTLPGLLGYLAALPWNQNNVAAEASPYTTLLEMQVGDELCRMLGYRVQKRAPLPSAPDEAPRIEDLDERRGAWGHVTCGGTIANIESMWAARNLKYYPLALAAALRDDGSPISHARGLRVRLPSGNTATLAQLDQWSLLNLKGSDILDLPGRLRKHYGVTPAQLVEGLQRHSAAALGLFEFHRRHLGGSPAPVVIGCATMHYSWPKGATLLGIGSANLLTVPVDLNCRLDMVALRRLLDECLAARRPVLQVVAILGTTEHSAVDPLHDILELRQEYRRVGLEFAVHVDAAWGGYFAALLRRAPPVASQQSSAVTANAAGIDGTDRTSQTWDDYRSSSEAAAERTYPVQSLMSRYVRKQFRALRYANSVTIDPHKAGFIPYPAGALCYKDVRTRELVSLRAPVVFHGEADPSVGVFGIEGSKPGAAVAAIYLSHRVIGLNDRGYGAILGKTMFNATRFYAAIATMDGSFGHSPTHRQEDCPRAFIAVPLQRVPAERRGLRPSLVAAERDAMAATLDLDNDALAKRIGARDVDLQPLFAEMGPDENIVAYAFNFYRKQVDPHGETAWMPNQDLGLLNRLNDDVFKALSVSPLEDPKDLPLIVTSSALDPLTLGQPIVRDFLTRLRVDVSETEELTSPVSFLITTIANPWLTDTSQPAPRPAAANRAAEAPDSTAAVHGGGTDVNELVFAHKRRHNMIPTLIARLGEEVRKNIARIRLDLASADPRHPSRD